MTKKYLMKGLITRMCACPIGPNDEIDCTGEIIIEEEFCAKDQWEHENGRPYNDEPFFDDL